MPQITQLSGTFASQIFWMLVVFGLIFFVVGRGMVPKVLDTVALRDRKIAEDLAAAAAARAQADEEEEAWLKRENDNRARAQEIIAEAKAAAARSTEGRLAETGVRLDAQVSEAEARIADARATALGEIEQVAAEAADDIVLRLAGVKVDADAARAAVKDALNG
ncbi:MAG: ATPase [Alphaproteobacteria bacterium]|nr:ATPase [Alphaproteobacteria bacterium]